MKISQTRILLILFIPLVISCESIAETCFITIKPKLMDKTLSEGIMSVYYYDTIDFDLNTDPGNVYYIREMTIGGNFPEGISVSLEDRSILLYGTPITPGTYEFNLNILLNSYDEDEDNDCFDYSINSYKIIIN